MNRSIRASKLIRIRREPFGYILFDRETREHHFARTATHLESLSSSEVRQFLAEYFTETKHAHYEFVVPPAHSMELSAPIGLYLEITQGCIFRCRHCYKPEVLPGELLSLSQFTALIDELHEIGVFEIRLCGNEPTASPYFFELCQYIQTRGFYLGVNTCAFFSEDLEQNTEFVSRLIDLAPNLVVVSLDGPKETHDVIRRPGSWDRAVYLLRCLSEAKIPRRINTLLSKSTIPHIGSIAELATEMACGVSYLPLRTIGRQTSLKEDEALDSESMHGVVKQITSLRSRLPGTRLLTYFDILGEKADCHHSMDCNAPCPARKNGFVAFDGSFFPCDILRYLGQRWYLGNVASESFWNLWTSSPVLHQFRHLEHSKCKTCKFYMKQCYGGCISGSIASSGQPDDELCFKHLLGQQDESN